VAHRAGTRIRPLRDGMRMFMDILKIRRYSLSGKYDAVRLGGCDFMMLLKKVGQLTWTSRFPCADERHLRRQLGTQPEKLHAS